MNAAACRPVRIVRACRRAGGPTRRASPRATRAAALFTLAVLAALPAWSRAPSAAAMADDGVSINIRRSSPGGSFRPPASASVRRPPGKRGAVKGAGKGAGKGNGPGPGAGGPAGEAPRLPRPTAETFGEDFSGRGKGRGAAPRRHGDGGVTLAAAGPGAKPWERTPKAKDVRKVEPASAPGAKDKNLARVRYGKAGSANRHDSTTFSVESFGDEALKLLPALVENLEHKFGASNMTHVQKGSVPAILQGADVLLRARTGTGKTLAYLVPIAQYLANRPERLTRDQGTHALIVVPTRELAVQVHDVLTNLLRPFHWLVPGILMGGEKKKSEKARIRKGLHVITGTPGRLTDHMSSTEVCCLSLSACAPPCAHARRARETDPRERRVRHAVLVRLCPAARDSRRI